MDKKSSRILSQLREGINYKILCISLLLIIIFGVGIYFTSYEWTQSNNTRIFLLSVFSTVFSLLIVFTLWETIGKRSFAKDMLHLAKISTNINESGIEYVYSDFKKIIWREELKYANTLTIAFSYGETWRNYNLQALEELTRDKAKITIYFPNYLDPIVVSSLSMRFSYSIEEIVSRIKQSAKVFSQLGASVFLYNGTFQSSYYLIDNIGFMAPFNHKKEKSYVPAIKVARGGSMYEYIRNEIDAIHENSIVWTGEEK